MSQPVHDVRCSFEDYVACKRTSNVKHEHHAGRIYAMAEGTPQHAALAASVSGLLFAQLGDGPCRVYSSDLRVCAGDLITYPDVTVVCGELAPDPRDPTTTLNPTLVVEVLSPSTERYDRGEKLPHYLRAASLKAVLLVAHDEPRARVEPQRREGRKEARDHASQARTPSALPSAFPERTSTNSASSA